MSLWVLVERIGISIGGGGGGGGGGGRRWHVGLAVGVTAMAGIVLAATIVISAHRGSLKSPWSRRKRKHVLTRQQWNSLFMPEGNFRDGGVKFLKKVRSGGIEPSIRAEVWPFLLGIYDMNSTEAKRKEIGRQKRKDYEKLRRQCRRLFEHTGESEKVMKAMDEGNTVESPAPSDGFESPASEVCSEQGCPDISIVDHVNNENSTSKAIERPSFDDGPESPASEVCTEQGSPYISTLEHLVNDETSASKRSNLEQEDDSGRTCDDASFEEEKSTVTYADASPVESESSDPESLSEEEALSMVVPSADWNTENDSKYHKVSSLKRCIPKSKQTKEDITTWQRIIRLDAIRANAEWVSYSPIQAAVSEHEALEAAASVGLKDFEHLEPCRIYHAARLVAVLEAYALYDPEIGYCQGMSDLLSPILAVIEKDDEAFWCFVGFMKKARHNFRLDEVGIRRQLNTVSKIIKSKDSHLYRHLEKLQAEDCFFVYRMVVVLFRRELDFEQTLCLWEVMWADQAAIRAGIAKTAWGRIRLRVPPTEDLLLYAIAACVLQKRKLIIESYNSMDEIIRECNNMAGHLDVWKLLDDAHDLVVTLHDKISRHGDTQ